ncbi:MAG: hypothetical protein CSA32_03320 [Desulfobulbus propionicus]|nr:MAG: hypothetical protein CSA32_03320 [Desulfobulbus propionicus]
MWTQPNKIALSFLFLVFIIAFGTLGFKLIDDYPLLDAMYMCVITISTVGYGEVHPLSPWGRLFSVVLIMFGFVVLGFAGHSLVESMLEKLWSGNVLEKKMKKKIDRLRKHYIICGFGRVGEVAGQNLQEAGVDFVVIDSSGSGKEKCLEQGILYLEGDATRESMLLNAGVKEACGLLALAGSDPLNLFIVLTARELNPTLHIIARSEDRHTEKKILRAGADSIISPFDSAGRRIAHQLLAATGMQQEIAISSPEKLVSSPKWVPVGPESPLLGKTLREITTSASMEIIGIRSQETDYLEPDTDRRVQEGDILYVFKTAKGGTYAEGAEETRKKLVIIDDNPVIVRLFSRLFHKAGYHPFTADNGEEGVLLIDKEKPAAAIVDYLLPGISGLDVCRTIRTKHNSNAIKIVMFTAENDEQLKDQCLEAGADAIIVKSADAREIIRTVDSML